MKNVRLLFIGIIFSHFVLKIANKLRHPEQVTKEETYRAMRDAREQWLREHQPKHPVTEVDARLMRSDPSAALASIGTVSDLEAALRPYRSPDRADAMAMGAIGSCNG